MPIQSRCGDETLDLVHLHFATLYRPDLGAQLINEFGSAREALSAGTASRHRQLGIPHAVAHKIDSSETRRQAERELEICGREGVHIWGHSDPAYPALLRQCAAFPLVLFAWGGRSCVPRWDRWPTVGVVGSRKPTPYGIRQTHRFAAALARGGVIVVSGLARGVDGEAHRACIDQGGHTIAVLGSGLGHIYPREHCGMARTIVDGDHGFVISPFPYGAPPKSFHFPLRNAIISGVSRVLFVVEAGQKSGSLITVDHALLQARTVYALPGRVDEEVALGSLKLIRDGAHVAVEPADLFTALLLEGEGSLPPEVRDGLAKHCGTGDKVERYTAKLDGPLAEMLRALFREADTWHPDAISERTGADVVLLLRELSRLETTGALRRLQTGEFVESPSSGC